MALLNCPDCLKEISDLAPACPHCGRPAATFTARPSPRSHAMAKRVALLGVIVACALVFQEVRHARALGVPTLTTLAYSGSLLTFGVPDNSTHTMVLALFVAGANDGGLGSAACTTTASVTCVNGQFTIPLSSGCTAVVQTYPNIEVEVTVDSTAMGLINISAVPYAIEAGTAASVGAAGITGVLPIINGGTNSSTQNFVDLSSSQTIAGTKTFSNATTIASTLSVTGSASFATTSPIDWMAVHAAATGACAAIDRSGGCCGHSVLAGDGATGCSTICATLSGSGRTGTCAGEVAIQPNIGQVSAAGQGVGSYYNYGCGGTGGNGAIESTAANAQNGYFDYCCCDVN